MAKTVNKAPETVTLKGTKEGGKDHVFSVEHANNLLRLQAKKGKKGWKLVDPNWKFENNELVKK